MMTGTPQIGLWGWLNSGKTTYLISLYRYLSMRDKPAYDQWRMVPANEAARTLVEKEARNWFPGGLFPEGTAAAHEYEFKLIRKRTLRGERDYLLKLVDGKGSYTTDRKASSSYFSALRHCHGLLCLIDPDTTLRSDRRHSLPIPRYDSEREAQTYFELLERLFWQLDLDNRNRLPYIAFCVTKMDRDESHGHVNEPREYCAAVIGNHASKLIRTWCSPDRHEFFCVSSVGRYNAPGNIRRPNIEPAGQSYRIADLANWEPFGLLEPMQWLVERIDAEKEGELRSSSRRATRGNGAGTNARSRP